jgi:hypothetical protein
LNNATKVSAEEMEAMLNDLQTEQVAKASSTEEDAEEIWAPSRSQQTQQDDTATSR